MKVEYNIGDKVRIVEAQHGALGANGAVGMIIKPKLKPYKYGGLLFSEEGIFVLLDNGFVWNIGIDVELEILGGYRKMTKDYTKEDITDIEVIVPSKVVEVTFGDGQKEKMICNKEDKYDLRKCLFIAIAKHLYKKDYTQEGIEYKANELKYLKKYVKIVDDALKEYHKKCENIKKLEDNYEKELESIARKRAKREAYKARREQKRKEEQIATQKEAYIQAMEYMENSKIVAAN